MAVDVLTVAAPAQAPLSTAVPAGPSFEQRWAAWQARGAAHDRAVRRRLRSPHPYCSPSPLSSSTCCSDAERHVRCGGGL